MALGAGAMIYRLMVYGTFNVSLLYYVAVGGVVYLASRKNPPKWIGWAVLMLLVLGTGLFVPDQVWDIWP